jgi:hypothetical protein
MVEVCRSRFLARGVAVMRRRHCPSGGAPAGVMVKTERPTGGASRPLAARQVGEESVDTVAPSGERSCHAPGYWRRARSSRSCVAPSSSTASQNVTGTTACRKSMASLRVISRLRSGKNVAASERVTASVSVAARAPGFRVAVRGVGIPDRPCAAGAASWGPRASPQPTDACCGSSTRALPFTEGVIDIVRRGFQAIRGGVSGRRGTPNRRRSRERPGSRPDRS